MKQVTVEVIDVSKLDIIEGIGESYMVKLNESGIKSVEALLEAGSTKQGRQKIAEASGISEKLILRWVNHADLFRVNGVGSEYADLLELCGVDTVVELATRRPDNLLAKMAEVNAEKKVVRKLPTAGQVEDWVAQAKSLPRVVQY